MSHLRLTVVSFDAPLTASQKKLAPLCSELVTRQITPPFIVLRQSVKIRQMQVECDGFQFGGAPRWAEFIFADDALVQVV